MGEERERCFVNVKKRKMCLYNIVLKNMERMRNCYFIKFFNGWRSIKCSRGNDVWMLNVKVNVMCVYICEIIEYFWWNYELIHQRHITKDGGELLLLSMLFIFFTLNPPNLYALWRFDFNVLLWKSSCWLWFLKVPMLEKVSKKQLVSRRKVKIN